MHRPLLRRVATTVAALLILAGSASLASAQVSLTAANMTTPYTEDFNTASANTTPVAGWQASAARYLTGTGSGTSGGFYVFNSGSDRALGSLGSGSASTTVFGAAFTNNTGGTITQVDITLDNKTFRARNTSDRSRFFFNPNATGINQGGSWTADTALDLRLVGTTTQRMTTITGLSIPNAQTFCIRWIDNDDSSYDSGNAVDNFEMLITAVGLFPTVTVTPSTPSPRMELIGSTDHVVSEWGISTSAGCDIAEMTIDASGTTVPSNDIAGIRVIEDTNGNGMIDGGEPVIASGSFGAGQSSATLTPTTPFSVAASTTYDWLLVLDLATTATNGATVDLALTSLLVDDGSMQQAQAITGVDADTVTIDGGPADILSIAPTVAVAGLPFSYEIVAVGGPIPTLTVTGLPSFLTFDGTDTISGTPQTSDVAGGPYTFTITATNGVGTPDTQVVTLAVIADAVAPGGFAIVAVQSDDPDTFAFVSFEDLDAGTVLSFTDRGWDPTLGAFADVAGDSWMQWEVPAGGLMAGDIVTIEATGTGTATVSSGAATGELDGLSDAGDQLTALLGGRYSNRVLATIHWGPAAFLASGTVATEADSAIPAELVTAGIGAIDLTSIGDRDNVQYVGPRDVAVSLDRYTGLISQLGQWTGVDDASGFIIDTTDFMTMGNQQPTIIVRSLGSTISNGVIPVENGSTLQSIDLEIRVDDSNFDPINVTVEITPDSEMNGFEPMELTATDAYPVVVLTPTTGDFGLDDTFYTITVRANDGNGGEVVSMTTVRVGTPPTPVGSNNCRYSLTGSTADALASGLLLLIGLFTLGAVRRRA